MARTIPIVLAAFALGLAAPALADDDSDPWRGLNQATHAFNETVDRFFLEPVAEGYDFAVPELVQDGVGNFFENLLVPRTVLNDLLQGEVASALKHTGRFMVNTTVGLGGLIDVASEAGMDHDPEDFGQTLGRWGVGPGPYLVLPLLGPSTLRDTVALPLDYAANPAFWVDEGAITLGATAASVTDFRAGAIEEIAENRKSAIDYYVFVRDAYLQNRAKRVNEGTLPPDDDLYDTDGL